MVPQTLNESTFFVVELSLDTNEASRLKAETRARSRAEAKAGSQKSATSSPVLGRGLTSSILSPNAVQTTTGDCVAIDAPLSSGSSMPSIKQLQARAPFERDGHLHSDLGNASAIAIDRTQFAASAALFASLQSSSTSATNLSSLIKSPLARGERSRAFASTASEPQSSADAISVTPAAFSGFHASGARGPPSASGSHRSRSSTTSKDARNNLHSRLQVISKATSSNEISPPLRRLRAALLVAVGCVCAIAILRFVLIGSLVSRYSAALNDVFLAARRRYLVTRVAVNTLNVALSNAPANSGPAFFSSNDASAWQSSIGLDASEIEANNAALFLDRGSLLSLDHYLLYTDKTVPLSLLSPAAPANVNGIPGFVFEASTESLWDATKLLVSAARALSVGATSAVTEYDENTYFVLRNSLST